MKNLHEQNNEFYQSYSLSKSHLKYVEPFSDIKSVYAKKGYKREAVICFEEAFSGLCSQNALSL